MVKNIDKNISKNLSDKYTQKLLDHAKHSAIPMQLKLLQKTAEVTDDFIGDKITKMSKNSEIIQKQLQINLIKKYLKNVYLQKKDGKLLMI